MDMFKFPYDKQICSLEFGNVIEPAEVVNISAATDEVDLDLFYSSSEFSVESHAVDTVSFQVGDLPFLCDWVNGRYIRHSFDIAVSLYHSDCKMCGYRCVMLLYTPAINGTSLFLRWY